MEADRTNSLRTCERFNAELEAHLEGDARPFVATHSVECPSCGNLLADMQWIQSASRELPQEEPAPDLWSRIRTTLAAERRPATAACERFAIDLEAYLEGEAPPFVVSHAQECPSCSSLLADMQAIHVPARDLSQEEPSPAVWSKISEVLRSEGAFTVFPCTKFADEVEAYLESEPRPFVETHVHECAACNALLSDLQTIQTAARQLPEAEPSRALWPAIREMLGREGVLVPAQCERFTAELEGYLEGEAQPFVLAHVKECLPCNSLLTDVESIRAAARALPQEDPSRAVWANVRARLEADGAFAPPIRGWRGFLQFFPQPAPLAALAGLVILATILSLPTQQALPGGAAQAVKAPVSGTQVATLTPPAEDLPLAHVVSNLESNFKANEASMTPDIKATYDKSLVSLDSSIEECLDSLHQEPGNTLAHDYLVTAYTRKAEVLSSALEFEGR